ncbi:MAG: DUF3090 family protein [Candidatus Rokuibacteriota bacterium]
MSDNPSFEIDSPDHFTTGAVGPPGQRVFYLQSRDAERLVTLKVEKEHVRALAEYLGGLLARVKAAPGAAGGGAELIEPLEAAWDVGSLAVGYDEGPDRVIVEASELIEADEEAETEVEPAMARFRITRAQAAAFVERASDIMKGGRPTCPICSRPMDPEGHVCPRANGHVKH